MSSSNIFKKLLKYIVKIKPKKEMNQNKEHDKKCPICGTKDWIEREGEDGKAIICNMCGFILSQDI